MAIRNCPNCGTSLKETNWGRKWCPNCGIIDDGNIEINDQEDRGYIR